jgi:hypothetical protein
MTKMKKTKTRIKVKAKPPRRRPTPKASVAAKTATRSSGATVSGPDVVEQEHEEADRQEKLTRSESDADTGARGAEDETDLEE